MAGRTTLSTNLLQEISEKLSALLEKLDTLTGISEEVDTVQKQQQETLLELKTVLQSSREGTAVGESQDVNFMKEFQEINIEKESARRKKLMSKVWMQNLNQRKQAFWNAYKCDNIAKIYEKWISRTNPILPRKFRFKEIEGESELEKEVRLTLAIQKLEAEIRMLRLKIPKYVQKFNAIDEEMRSEIERATKGNVRLNLLESWDEDVLKQESKSIDIWQGKLSWMREYENNYGNEPVKRLEKRQNASKKRKRSPIRNAPIRDPRNRSQSKGPMNYAAAVKRNLPRKQANRFNPNFKPKPKAFDKLGKIPKRVPPKKRSTPAEPDQPLRRNFTRKNYAEGRGQTQSTEKQRKHNFLWQDPDGKFNQRRKRNGWTQ